MSSQKKNWFQRLFGGHARPDATEELPPHGGDEGGAAGNPTDRTNPTRLAHAEDSGAREATDSTEPTGHDGPSGPAEAEASERSAADEMRDDEPGESQKARRSSVNASAVDASATLAITPGPPISSQRAELDPASLDDVEFFRRMRVRLEPASPEAMDGDSVFSPDSPVREFTADTSIRLMLDVPSLLMVSIPRSSNRSFDGLSLAKTHKTHTSVPLDEADLADRGPVDDLYRMGYRNLWQDLIDSDLHVEEIEPNGEGKIWMFEATSPYVGSAPIFLEEIMQRYLPQVDTSQGLLFSMPTSSQMVVKEVTSGKELIQTIGLLATASADEYFRSPDRLSVRLHLWHEGQIETISDIKLPSAVADGSFEGQAQAEIHIQPNGYLMAQINEGNEGGPDDPFGSPMGPDGTV